MLKRTQHAVIVAAIVNLATGVSYAQTIRREVIFSEDVEDVAIRGWHGARPPAVKFTRTQGPDGVPALTIETREPVSSTLPAILPAERIAGKAVLLEVWRKAENADPHDHPNGIRHEFVFSYLKNAPERVQLAADWVEYCKARWTRRSGSFALTTVTRSRTT